MGKGESKRKKMIQRTQKHEIEKKQKKKRNEE